ncbi:MAG: phosphate ABC transporter permease subunit PstC [candidate division Zixibacteria bacterium]|nr:phosphate ABC transporter permease subunit PstC [candidate division Zixibacteria bacterium]MDD5425638.1 phosphate ABC transporter permease subunit PstC [candidate division Zixibacteria bacterium]
MNKVKLQFKPKSRWREFLGEKFIALNALVALAAIFLIFAFIFKESLPVFTDPEVKEEASVDKMVFKQVYYEGREPKYSWQPNSIVPKYSLMPLFIGTVKAAIIAMLFAIPLGVGAAIYSAEFASHCLREIIKPVIELLAGIPSVVLGFFALIVLATFLQKTFGFVFRLNAVNAGMALGVAVIPIIFTVAEDAMTSVPNSLRDAALALGANPWQVSLTVVLPAALPGIAAGVILGFGRAIGETMIVLMASGNAAIISASFADSIRTISATIAAELAEVVFGGAHYSVLFFLGTLLFVFTFLINMGGDYILTRIKVKFQGRLK